VFGCVGLAPAWLEGISREGRRPVHGAGLASDTATSLQSGYAPGRKEHQLDGHAGAGELRRRGCRRR
jgi:hypothetical protein